jgi:hypothetical protein
MILVMGRKGALHFSANASAHAWPWRRGGRFMFQSRTGRPERQHLWK